jgi:hypothetical protein
MSGFRVGRGGVLRLFWPQDHAWCVVTEIDLFCTIIAGSDSLAEALNGNVLLETLRVTADDPIH